MPPKPIPTVPPAGAQVGVFWVHEGHVLADRLPVAKGFTYEGVVNGRRDHIEVWPEIQRRVPALREVDYIEVPRGRVQFWPLEGRFVVLFDRVLGTPALKAAICAAFGLPRRQVRFRFDPHYQSLQKCMRVACGVFTALGAWPPIKQVNALSQRLIHHRSRSP